MEVKLRSKISHWPKILHRYVLYWVIDPWWLILFFSYFFRGQDWSGGDIDGGEGGVGTIVERIKPSASTSQERSIVIVLWDSTGQQSQCVTGHMNSFALRVIDNALVGIRHEGKKCKFCNEDDNSVAGILWACSTCNGVSLCTAHYMGDKHDLSHPFLRFDTPTSPALMLLPRKGSRKQQIKGVFPGAKVQRSADWMWQGKLPHLLLIKL